MPKWMLLVGVLMLGFCVSAMAQETPKAEIFGGYSYLRANILGEGFNFNGGSGSVALNANNWFGIVGDFGGYHLSQSGVSVNIFSYTFGPKLAYRKSERLTPFGQALFGGARASAGFAGQSASENAFALALGGGVDAKVTPHVAIRLVQVEYVLTKFTDGRNDRQNNARISTGIVFRVGGR